MIQVPRLDDELVARLISCAAAWTGFHPDAILPDAIRRALEPRLRAGLGGAELLREALAGSPAMRLALSQAVSVGETYFFRHPDHFAALGAWLDRVRWDDELPLRAWSAGCASGEEAWSLAACLLAHRPAGSTRRIEVLGTDLLERNVELARRGEYGRWSVRSAGPMLFDTLEPLGPERYRVREALRPVTRFEVHNLLHAPLGSFDFIFCRNVLVYFSPVSSRAVCAHLAQALSDDGLLVFGTMDLPEPPLGLRRVGPAELQAFARPLPPSRLPAAPTATEAPSPRPAAPRPSPACVQPAPSNRSPAPARPRGEPVALHLKALALLEHGERERADALLEQLGRDAPDYLPALLERALLASRSGRQAAASGLLRELLRRAQGLPPAATVPGPEPLPLSFYVDSARNFLALRGVGT